MAKSERKRQQRAAAKGRREWNQQAINEQAEEAAQREFDEYIGEDGATYFRVESLAAKCEEDPWKHEQPWDFSFPDTREENWHISPDFIDPMVNKYEEWDLESAEDAGQYNDVYDESAKEIEDIWTLVHFADHLGGMGFSCCVSVISIGAWVRAKAWLDANMPAGFRDLFEREVKVVSEAARDVLAELCTLFREGDRVVVDDTTDSSAKIAYFRMEVDLKRIQYLRDLSVSLRKRVPPKGRKTGGRKPPKRKKPAKKKKPGPKGPRCNVTRDAQIFDEWKSSAHTTIEAFARCQRNAKTDVEVYRIGLAIDRERKRRRRRRKRRE